MRKHVKYGAVAGAVAAPLAIAALVVPASATNGGDASSAYGIAADGLVTIPRTPVVTTERPPSSRSVLSLPGTSLVRFSVLRARAVPGHSEASVVDLRIAKAAIRPGAVLSAKLIPARCDDGAGSSRLVDVRL